MKKFLANLTALTIAAAALPAAVGAQTTSALGTDKQNWIVGTSGTLTGAGLTSSAPDVVTVNADGTFEAKSAGNAVITDGNGESITLHVYDKAPEDVVQNVCDDVAAGKLVYDYTYRYSKPMSELRTGTKLWSYMSAGNVYVSTDTGSVFNGATGDQASIGFVYKLDGALDSVTLNTFGYDATEVAAARTELGYTTTGDEKFSTQNDGTHTLNGERLTAYATEFALIGDEWKTPVQLSNLWTKVELPLADWSSAGANGLDKLVTTDQVPADAQFIAILLETGTLADGTPAIAADRYRYKGITLHYRRNLMAGELTADQKIALTFNGDVADEDMTVRKNGKIITPEVRYDAETFTKYLDNTFDAGDEITVTTKYDQYTVTIPGTPAVTDYDKIYFAPEKHTFTVGTTGKIDLITEKDGERRKNLLTAAYTSSDSEIVEIDQNGNLTAKRAGTAEITPSVPSLEQTFEPIAIQVCETTPVSSYVDEDATNGALTLDYERSVKMSEKRHGTKVWAYASDSQMLSAGAGKGVMTNRHAETEYMAFVYRLEGTVKNITVNTYGYGSYETYAPDRTEIGYLTDDTVTFQTKAGDGNYTWDSDALNFYGSEGGIVGDASKPIKMNEKVWTKIQKSDIDFSYQDDRNIYFKTSAVPKDAKYLVVLLKLGELEDGTAALGAQSYRYRGITIDYAPVAVKGELNLNNQAVLTMNTDVGAAWTVKKNGVVMKNAKIRYDKANYTYYVDGGFENGDEIEITSAYGSYTAAIEDSREQLSNVVLKNANGESVSELTVGDTGYTVEVSFKNAGEGKAYAALYDAEGRLVKCVSAAAGANTLMQLSDLNLEGGENLRIFGWKNQMQPYAVYNAKLQTTFTTGDF